jgi:subtilase family serine protease
MAPDANILYAGAENCLGSLFSTVQKVVDGHLADIITNSWGDNAGDVLDDAGTRAAFDNIALMAAGTGISLMFSSGDNGDEFTTVGLSVPDYPPTSPWVTAVGGTTVEIGEHGRIGPQFGWSTARSFLCNDTFAALGGCAASQQGTWTPFDPALDGGSGGGTSFVYGQPSYQAGVVPFALSHKNASLIGSGDPTRVVPDISMDGDPGTGFLVGETQTFPNGVFYDQYRIGGTSLSSPLFAGLIALADQANGSALGFLNPLLYSLHNNAAAVTDILPSGKQDESRADWANSLNVNDGRLFTTRLIGYQGQEAFCPPTNDPKCIFQDVSIPALPGYDAMTGLGTPGSNFIAALTGK